MKIRDKIKSPRPNSRAVCFLVDDAKSEGDEEVEEEWVSAYLPLNYEYFGRNFMRGGLLWGTDDKAKDKPNIDKEKATEATSSSVGESQNETNNSQDKSQPSKQERTERKEREKEWVEGLKKKTLDSKNDESKVPLKRKAETPRTKQTSVSQRDLFQENLFSPPWGEKGLSDGQAKSNDEGRSKSLAKNISLKGLREIALIENGLVEERRRVFEPATPQCASLISSLPQWVSNYAPQ